MLNSKSFTAHLNVKANVLKTSVLISANIPNTESPDLKIVAIWDTGATNSVINESVAADLGLIPSGKSIVNGVTGSDKNANTYKVSVSLPNNIKVSLTAVAVHAVAGDAQMLIGMDVIGLGDFSISNVNNLTVFSFRVPSVIEADFVRDHNEHLKSLSEVGSSSEDA